MWILHRLPRHFCINFQPFCLHSNLSCCTKTYQHTTTRRISCEKNCEIHVDKHSNEGAWVICAKTSFLHRLGVLSKMFAYSLAVLNQQTLYRTDHVHCFQILLMEACLVVWFWVDNKTCCFLLQKNDWIRRLGSGLMVSGIDLQFTFYSKNFTIYFVILGVQRGTH